MTRDIEQEIVHMSIDDWSVDVYVPKNNILTYAVTDVKKKLYRSVTNNLQYIDGRTFTDGTMQRRRLSRYTYIPSRIWLALDYDFDDVIVTMNRMNTARQWVTLDTSILIHFLRASFLYPTCIMRQRHPSMAAKVWRLYMGGTQTLFQAFIGYEVDNEEEHDVTLPWTDCVESSFIKSKSYVTAIYIELSLEEQVSVKISVGKKDYIHVKLSPGHGVAQTSRASPLVCGLGMESFADNVLDAMKKAARFHMEKMCGPLKKDMARLALPSHSMPQVSNCHVCQDFTLDMLPCGGCMQAIYCEKCRDVGARKNNAHVPMCAVNTWGLEVELGPPCDACSSGVSVNTAHHCTVCKSFWCKRESCSFMYKGHACTKACVQDCIS